MQPPEPPALRIQHLSHSSVQLWKACGRAWEAKYVLGVKHPVTPALVFGSAFGKTLELALRAKAVTGILPDLQLIWDEQWTEYSAQEIVWGGELPEQYETMGAKLLATKGFEVLREGEAPASYTNSVLDHLTPLIEQDKPALERYVELHVPPVPLALIGYIDLILPNGTIIDFKTSARAWTLASAAKKIQPLVYLAALAQEHWPLLQLHFVHVVFVKTKKPQVQWIETTYTPAQLYWLMNSIQCVWWGMSHGVFAPNEDAYMCSASGCGIWQDCAGRR